MVSNTMSSQKWLVEVMDESGIWKMFNHFTGPEFEIKDRVANIIVKTKYQGIRYSLM